MKLIITQEKAQIVLDTLQVKPYKEVSKFVKLLFACEKVNDEHNSLLLMPSLVKEVLTYLGNLPFKEVYRACDCLESLRPYEEPKEPVVVPPTPTHSNVTPIDVGNEGEVD